MGSGYTTISGAGSIGTSYSGGTGGGDAYLRFSYINNGEDGHENGGAGGEGSSGGGTGNPGGEPKGIDGTGGLLILYANKLNNINSITSKGTESNGYGGASGGGSVNIFYNNLINKGTVETTGGNGGEGGNGGNGCVTFTNLSFNINSCNIIVDEIANTSIRVNIENSNSNVEGITYDYYLNNKKYIENSTSIQETITDLNFNANYEVVVNINYNGSVISSNIVNIKTTRPEIYVATNGDDENGDGSESKPFASLSKAINMSEDGYGIYVKEGTYNLEPMYIDTNSKNGAGGIYDQGKHLDIYGENERTILVYDGANTNLRDAPAMELANSETVVRNLTYIFKPKKASYNYPRAIFRNSRGNIKNVFFRIEGDYKASYLYHNNQTNPNNIINCTFYHNLGAIDTSYSGIANFENVATNVLPRDKWNNINTIEKDFGLQDYSITQLINASKEDADFNENQVGVFYGENAWSR